MFEFLINGEKLLTYQEIPATWGKKEVEPTFTFVSFEGTKQEADYILRYCKWENNNFVHTITNEIFDSSMIIPVEIFPDRLHVCKKVLVELTGNPDVTFRDGLEYQRPEYQAEWRTEEKVEHFVMVFLPWRHIPEVMEAIKGLQNGCFGYFYQRLKLIPPEIFSQIDMCEEDKTWLAEKWGIM